MKLKKLVILLLVLSATVFLAAEKSMEIIAQETAVEGENLFKSNDFVGAGKKFEEAIAKYDEFIKKQDIPEDRALVDKWLKNASASYQKGKAWEDMIRIKNIQIERNPKVYNNYKYKAIVYKSKLKNYQAAIDAYKQYDENVRPYFTARVKIADIYYQNLEDYENALIWYKKANELKEDSTTLNKTAQTYLKLKRNTEAVNVIKDYIATNPDERELFKSYFNLGTIYMNDMNNVQEALNNYEKAVSYRFDKNATLFMIENYFQTGNFDKTKKHISAFLNKYPNNKDVVYYRGLIDYTKAERLKDDKPAEAKELYKSAKKDFDQVPLTSTHGSDAKTKSGYIEKLLKQL